MGLEEEEIAILFAGRLNFIAKANPLALLIGIEKAAKDTKKKINYSLKEKRIGELDYTCCLNKDIQKEVNWKPTKNIESIVKSTLKWKKK